MTRVAIRQRRSAIGEKERARRTLSALGLGRTGQTVTHEDTPVLRGMLRQVAHLVIVDADGASEASTETNSSRETRKDVR